MHWIDIGANLTHESFELDRAAVIERARATGVLQLLVTGTSVQDSERALHLARAYPQTLYATAGVHPHNAAQLLESDLPALRSLLAQPEVLAVGECGLDYHREHSPRAAQLRAFEWQLRLAAECAKPVFLHQRAAHADFVAVLREHRQSLAAGVAHCFTDTAREMEAYLALELSIGITGWICDERRGTHLAAVVAAIPRGRLLLETDAPYLLPRDLPSKPKSRRNEPMYLPHIGAVVARARGESIEDCARQTTANARALFGFA